MHLVVLHQFHANAKQIDRKVDHKFVPFSLDLRSDPLVAGPGWWRFPMEARES